MATLSAPSLAEIIVEVRALIGQPDETNSNVTNESLTYWVNEAVRRYFAELVQNSEGQFGAVTNLAIVSGTESVALPSDCFRIRNLYRKVSDGYVSLSYIQGAMGSSYSSSGDTSGDGYIPTFYIRGNDIILRPIPIESDATGLKIEYIQLPETLIDSGDYVTSQVNPLFRDLIIAYTAYKAKLVEGNGNINLTESYLQNLNDLFKAFKESVTPRSEYPQFAQVWDPESN